MDACEPFKNKKITLMGLGVLGRGVGDAEFLAGCGARVLVTDKKTEVELAESVQRLKKYPNISFRLGEHRIEDFRSCDMVLKAAGVPLDSPEIAGARQGGIPVAMSTALFAKYATEAGATIVGVTGTRGKTTVAHMMYHSLISAFAKASADRRAHPNVFLGGNVRGTSTLAMLPEIGKGDPSRRVRAEADIVVLELDSWQLQGFGDLKISPHVAVFTNLMPDHMNYYKGDMNTYFADKANIFAYQSRRKVGTPTEASGKASDTLIVGKSVEERVRAARPKVAPQVPPAIPSDWKLKIVGEHNRENASFAAAALKALGLSEQHIREGLESFKPVEGRLQLVREIDGVKIYNDNNATTPEATIAALRSVGENKNVILIAGGADKGLDMSALVSGINRTCKAVVLLAGSGTNSLLQAPSSKLQAPTHGPYDSPDQAVNKALELARKTDTILFSPAFASFGMFKNEYDRNDQFIGLVRKLS